MVAWLEPLNLEVFFITLFAGDPQYFLALALIIISAVAGYLRMTTLTLFFMIGIFILMFSGYVTNYIVVLFAIIAGLAVGYTINKIVDR
jgi:hypothetical protein